MTSIEDAQAEVNAAKKRLEKAEAKLAELNKKDDALENGEPIGIPCGFDVPWVSCKWDGYVSVEADEQDDWSVVLRYGFGTKESCLEEARKILGGKSD